MRLLEGPDLQAVDVEVLLGGEWLVVEGRAFGGGASVQLSIQPQTQLTTAQEGAKSQKTCVHYFYFRDIDCRYKIVLGYNKKKQD